MDKMHFIVSLLLIYVCFGIFLYFFQTSMIYHPSSNQFGTCLGFKDYEAIVHNNTRFYYKSGGENFIIYYHGNAGSACDRSVLRQHFEQPGFSVIFVVYSGYSSDTVRPNKRRILQNVRDVHEFVMTKNPKKVVVFGESIGVGPASYHTTLGDVDTVILTAPFYELADIARSQFFMYPISLLLRENYRVFENLRYFEGKIYLIHGMSDRIIQPRHSQKLYRALDSHNVTYIGIDGFGHNDIWHSREFVNHVETILRRTD